MFEQNKTINEILGTDNTLTIKIKYHNDVEPIEKINVGDWIDLRAAESYTLFKEDFQFLSLGVSMKLPEGYEAIIAPRSSLFKKHGLIVVNSIGIIDNSYSGNKDIWKLPVYCLKPFTKINKNERIAQFRIIQNQPEVNFEVVENLPFKNRGGFGSTGSD